MITWQHEQQSYDCNNLVAAVGVAHQECMSSGELRKRLAVQGVGGQTRVDLATLALSPCFTGLFGPVNGVNLIKTL